MAQDRRITILLLAGSGESRALAEALAWREDIALDVHAAGPLRGMRFPVQVKTGGFGGEEGFRAHLAKTRPDAIIDATHPYAERITARTARVARELGLPMLHHERPPWVPGPGDEWVEVGSPEEVYRVVPDDACVFLGTGRAGLERFACLEGRRVICRQLDAADGPFPFEGGEFLLSVPPFTVEGEMALFHRLEVDWLVVKNAGGEGRAAEARRGTRDGNAGGDAEAPSGAGGDRPGRDAGGGAGLGEGAVSGVGRIIEGPGCVAEGAAHLAATCPRMAHALERTGQPPLRRTKDGFAQLLSAIVSQQVSVAAAAAIWGRLKAARLTGPRKVMWASDEELRACGLSRPKVRYARALAEARIDYAALREAPDEEVVAVLTEVPGIGRWTAEIYAMFALGRADVFAPADLALQEAARMLYGLDARPTERELRAMAEAWTPWRAVAARLLWAYFRVAKDREGIR